MAESEATTFGSFSESDGDSILFVILLTSQKTAKRNRTFQRRLVVKYYRIVSNQRDALGPSESEDEAAVLTSTSVEERIGNTDLVHDGNVLCSV